MKALLLAGECFFVYSPGESEGRPPAGWEAARGFSPNSRTAGAFSAPIPMVAVRGTPKLAPGAREASFCRLLGHFRVRLFGGRFPSFFFSRHSFYVELPGILHTLVLERIYTFLRQLFSEKLRIFVFVYV